MLLQHNPCKSSVDQGRMNPMARTRTNKPNNSFPISASQDGLCLPEYVPGLLTAYDLSSILQNPICHTGKQP
jgi:hypothetical protein